MEITLKMSVVTRCDVSDCAYNLEQTCNARAITIGDGVLPGCDTFFSNSTHTHEVNQMTGVGACKVTSCMHNLEFECGAESIIVGHSKAGIRCLTYALK